MTYFTYPHMQYETEMKALGTGVLPLAMDGPSGGGGGTGEAMGPDFETQFFYRSSIHLPC